MLRPEPTRRQRVAVVTGASRGIGFATADALLAKGYRVACFSHNEDAIRHASAELALRHDETSLLCATVDLREPSEVRRFFERVGETWSAPSVLVCNAGVSPKGPDGLRVAFADITAAEWHEALTVNLISAAQCCQYALPAMAREGFGRIILIGSVASRALPFIAGAAYTTSKSGLGGVARAIVSEYSPRGVTANIIAPGLILTEMAGPPESPKNRAALARIPIRKFGRPEDIARVVVFLAADDAYFINGATIDVNGGEYLAP